MTAVNVDYSGLETSNNRVKELEETVKKAANLNNYIKEASRLSTIKEGAKDALALLNFFKSNDIENILTKIIKLCEE